MGKLFLAFAAGVALASMAFVLFDGVPATPVPEQSVVVAPLSRSAPDPIREIAPSNETPTATEVASVAVASATFSDGAGLPEELTRFTQGDWARKEQERRDMLSAWTNEELQVLQERAREMTEPSQEMQEAQRVMGLARLELLRRENVARWADEPPDMPIGLPPQFDYLSEFPNGSHEMLQRNPVDPNWSPQMEAQLQGFFAARPEITATFGFPTINCRTMGCEIAFVAYGLDDARSEQGINEPAAAGEFRRVARMELDEQPWADQLNVGAPDYRFQDGATTFLWHVYRLED